MYTISLLNNKGGVFKTTLAFNLAKQYLRNNRNVVTIDFDQQENLSRMLPDITQSNVKASDISDIDADYVIVDTGPTFVMSHIQLMKESDLIIIPFQLDRMDIEQTTTFLETVHDLGVAEKTKLIVIHSGHHTQMYKALKPFVDQFSTKYGVEILCEMRRNQSVPKANLEYKTVFEINSPPEVRQEFKTLFKSVGAFLGSLNKNKVNPNLTAKEEVQSVQI